MDLLPGKQVWPIYANIAFSHPVNVCMCLNYGMMVYDGLDNLLASFPPFDQWIVGWWVGWWLFYYKQAIRLFFYKQILFDSAKSSASGGPVLSIWLELNYTIVVYCSFIGIV